MILLCGIRSEPPLALVAAELDRLGADTHWFDQRRALEISLGFEVAGGGVTGELADRDSHLPLDEVRAVYLRVMDDRLLPEVEHLPPDAPERASVRALHDKLAAWIEITPALVVNRAARPGEQRGQALSTPADRGRRLCGAGDAHHQRSRRRSSSSGRGTGAWSTSR